MPILTPETLADIINNADDGKEMNEYNRTVIRSGDIWKRHPADFAMALQAHYKPVELDSFAEPRSRQKEGTDWRGQPFVPTNRRGPMIWDHGDQDKGGSVVSWYTRFVERLESGAEIAKPLSVLRKVMAWRKNPEKNDISGLDTKITYEKTSIQESGKPELVTVDTMSPDMTPTELSDIASALAGNLTTLANGYRKAYAIVKMWRDIEATPELTKHVAIDWNWYDSQNKARGRVQNRPPIRVYARKQDGTLGNWIDVNSDRFTKFDLDEAVKNGGTHKALLESKWKAPDGDDRAMAGQGKTDEAKQRESKIKLKDFPAAVEQSALFLMNNGSRASFESWFYQASPEDRKAVAYYLVKLDDSLERLISEEVLELAKTVEKEQSAAEATERAAKAKVIADREQAERQPTQAQKNAAQAAPSAPTEQPVETGKVTTEKKQRRGAR